MRFINILFQKYRLLVVLILCVFLTKPISAQNEPEGKSIITSVNIKVVDDNGALIPNALVVVDKGTKHVATDENGTCSFMAYPDDFVTVSATGYDKNVSLVQDIINNNTVKLLKSKLYMTSDDDVPYPFYTLKKRYITGSSAVLTDMQLEKYPTIDLRNAFTGLVPGLQITENNGQTGTSAEEGNGTYGITEKIDVSARGRSMMYIIDDVPTDITEMPLDPEEIESVTIIKDIVGKAMYGPAGANGIILIKTKRGRMNEHVMKVTVEDGTGVIDRMPGWTTGADYADLNNLAMANNGLQTLYSNENIDAYKKNDPYDMYHPSVNYRDLMLKNTKPFRKANMLTSGGNENVQYSSYLGYSGEGDILKIGSISDYNRLNARSNVDIKINKYINMQFDIYGGLTFRRSPNYGYATSESSSTMSLVELNSALADITSIAPNAFPVYANNDPSLKDPWFAVSSTYPNNPIGNIVKTGSYNETGRMGKAKVTLDFDLSQLVKGLKSRTDFSWAALNLVRIGGAENYLAYTVTPSKTIAGNDTIKLAKVHDGYDTPDLSNLHDYYFQRYGFYENLSYEKDFGNNYIQTTLTYFFSELKRNGYTYPQRQQNAVLTGLYSFNDKYIIQGVLNYAGSYSLTKYNLFPSIGAGWVISDESFMSNLKFLNYLKLRAEAGILGVESFMSPYYYRTAWSYTTGSAFGPFNQATWFGTTREASNPRSYEGRIGNPGITWEKAKEFNVGLDALLFNQKLTLEVNYFINQRDGQISQLSNSVAEVIGVSSALPYFNYNSTKYFGLETGIRLTESFGSFSYSVGGNATIMNSKLVKYDEPNYRYNYQFHTGTPADTYWGQTFIGKFTSDAEALVVPQVYDVLLKEGDLKYKDMNNDGFIDDNDRSAIGHTTPRLFYSLNARFSYRNFELYILGTGCAFYDIPLTNAYYWNGWGVNNYSKFVKENVGGAYPRLTYYKVNNNFLASDFWLTKGDYFKIQNIELAYNLPADKLKIIRSRGVRLFVRGANLLTLSQIKDVDPESINSGISVYPLFRTFTGGIKFNF